VFSGVINNLCRSAPFLNLSNNEVDENRMESWEKEIGATQELDQPQKLDYRCWFSDDSMDIHRPLGDHLPPAPRHNHRIREAFREWRESLRGAVFYPQIQPSKSVSRQTAQQYQEKVSGHDQVGDNRVSSAMLERWYADTGMEIGGPCEIRQAWKYNDLTPRTYFSQGGTTFHSSKHIRQVPNSLAAMFPETHFLSRFSIHDLALESFKTAFIYDYISFTSLLAELKYFLEELASFTEEIEIIVIDSHQGPLNWFLGSLIREYNQACNTRGDFMVQRYDEYDSNLYQHHLAGFLGVYGNIAFSTILHGLHACQLGGDLSEAKCVGDDVFGVIAFDRETTRDTLIARVQVLGRVQQSKFRFWEYRDLEFENDDDRAWPYIKRPLDRFQNRMIHEPGLFLPIFGLINPIPDGIHEGEEDLETRIRILAHQTFSTIRQARALYPPLEGIQVDSLRSYLKTLYKATGCQESGLLPFESIFIKSHKITGLFLPSIDGDFIEQNPWDLLKHRFDNRPDVLVRIPRTSRERIDGMAEILRSKGAWVESTSERALTYLEHMEWVVKRELHEVRYMDYFEYSSFYSELFAGNLYKIAEYSVVSTAPDWIYDLDRL